MIEWQLAERDPLHYGSLRMWAWECAQLTLNHVPDHTSLLRLPRMTGTDLLVLCTKERLFQPVRLSWLIYIGIRSAEFRVQRCPYASSKVFITVHSNMEKHNRDIHDPLLLNVLSFLAITPYLHGRSLLPSLLFSVFVSPILNVKRSESQATLSSSSSA